MAKHTQASQRPMPDLGRMFDRPAKTLARAAAGDPRSIANISQSAHGREAALQHGVAALFAVLASKHGIAVPDCWRHALRSSVATRMLLEVALSDLGATLDAAGIPWLPLKGMGAVAKLYPCPECRPTTDLDVLIPLTELDHARSVLCATKDWQSLEDDSNTPFDRDAIYNWKAIHDTGVTLELHYTLWGPIDPDLTPTLLDRAVRDPHRGRCSLESQAPEIYIIGAAHLWNAPRPRTLINFVDLLQIDRVADDSFSTTVIALSRRHDLQLFVGLAAGIAATLWNEPSSARIARTLLSDLRFAERRVLARAPVATIANIHLARLVFARLLAQRKSRSGWTAPFRFAARSTLSPFLSRKGKIKNRKI